MEATKEKKSTGPDVKELKDRELPKAEFPGRKATDFRVFIEAAVHSEIRAHATDDKKVEICGVLVGKWHRDDEGPYVAITASIRGEAVANKMSEVTFTHETWAKIHKRMDAEFADRFIVGWYHSHPDFGIFLSDRDRFIHEHFFREPGQIAYVVDPVRGDEGIFTWKDGDPTPAPYYWVGGRLQTGTYEDSGRDRKERKAASSSSPGGPSPQQTSPSRSQEPPGGIWVSVLWGVCIFLFGYAIAGHFAAWRVEQMMRTDMQKLVTVRGARPGLGPNLQAVNKVLGQISARAKTLSENPAATTQPSIWKLTLHQTAVDLAVCQQALEDLRELYGLTPTEEALLQSAIAKPTPSTQTASPASNPATSKPAATQKAN